MAQTIASHRTAKWVAWGLFGLVALMFCVSIIFEAVGCRYFINPTPEGYSHGYSLLVAHIAPLAFAFLGVLIFLRHPENRISWVILSFASIDGMSWFVIHYANCQQQGNLALPGEIYLWMDIILGFGVLSTLGLFLMMFPNGRFLSQRWQRLSLITLGFMVAYLIWGFATQETNIPSDETMISAFLSPLFVFPLLGFLALFLRWYYAEGVIRQQIKWLAFFLLTFGTFYLVAEIVATYFGIGTWLYLFAAVSFIGGFPLVFGIAIFKYRLYDIDIIIRRTVQYGVVSALLAVVYFGSITLIQRGLTGVTGNQSPFAIVLSTLLIAALFNPVRHRVQTAVDRRFYRQKYDAQQVLANFAVTARDETDLDRLTFALQHVVEESMQPEGVSVWLRQS